MLYKYSECTGNLYLHSWLMERVPVKLTMVFMKVKFNVFLFSIGPTVQDVDIFQTIIELEMKSAIIN